MYTSFIPREFHLSDLLDKEQKIIKIKKEFLNMGSPPSLIDPQKLYNDKNVQKVRVAFVEFIYIVLFVIKESKVNIIVECVILKV